MVKVRPWVLSIVAVILTRCLALPRSAWEFDEMLFFRALHHYDPASHFPPPPGYPVFILVGKIARAVIPSDFAALVTLSFIASVVGFVLLALAFRNISGELDAALAGALLFYMSPAMLVNSTLPMSDPGALALFSAALWGQSFDSHFSPQQVDESTNQSSDPMRAAAFGAVAALTVGWRPQFSIAVVPLVAVTLLLMRSWRDRAAAVIAFGVICLLWLIPLVIAVGGVERFMVFEGRQATYLAAHDAELSRSDWTSGLIAARFIAHPWGPKLLSVPLLLVACAGAARMLADRRRLALPIAAAGLVYLGFALLVLDPADGVRYALPSSLAVALLAGVGVVELSRRISPALNPYVAVALYSAGSMVYVGSLITQRRMSDSPPVRAAAFARDAFPANAVALYELPLWPHATYFLADRHPMRVDVGLREFFARPDVPLFLLADGSTRAPGARIFRWAASDAYSKLTRNHYRVVSVIPLPPPRRFAPVAGIYPPEREIEGDEWRWLAARAELQLPPVAARTLHLRLGLPMKYPFADNVVTVTLGNEARTVRLKRAQMVDVVMPIPRGASRLRIDTAKTFTPASLPGSRNRDPRQIGVQLYDFFVN